MTEKQLAYLLAIALIVLGVAAAYFVFIKINDADKQDDAL